MQFSIHNEFSCHPGLILKRGKTCSTSTKHPPEKVNNFGQQQQQGKYGSCEEEFRNFALLLLIHFSVWRCNKWATVGEAAAGDSEGHQRPAHYRPL